MAPVPPSRLGPLRVRRLPATGQPSGTKAKTLVLMHGFGAPGDDLVGLAPDLPAPGGTSLVFPEAPHALADLMALPFLGDARAWWAIDVERFQRASQRGSEALVALTREVPEGLADARDAVVAMLDALEAEGTPSDRVVLGGFSQGSMLAIDVALRSSRPLAGLVVLSGTLIAADEWRPRMASRAGLPVFQSHGASDPILPMSVARELRSAFEGAGMRVTWSEFAGGHGVAPTVLRDLGAFLAALP